MTEFASDALPERMDPAELRLWTMLEPHVTDSYKQEAEAARQEARKDLEDENNSLCANLRQMRGQQ